jgi:cell cycle arrest protein BUB3
MCNTGNVVTGSWDKTLKFWDPRINVPLTDTLSVPEKVFCASVSGHKLVVGLAQRKILVYDTRNLSIPAEERMSGLKHMTRAIECMPNGICN